LLDVVGDYCGDVVEIMGVSTLQIPDGLHCLSLIGEAAPPERGKQRPLSVGGDRSFGEEPLDIDFVRRG
jgi:hypothetical protein